MKKNYTLFLSFISMIAYSQNPTITIDIGNVVTSDSLMKPILGVISGPDANYNSANANLTTQFQNIGVTSIRNNDYSDDRLDMDLMFNCGGATYPSWGSCSPTVSANYNFTASDIQYSSYVSGGFEPFLRLGSENPPTSGPFVKDNIGPINSTEETNWIIAADTVAKHYSNFPGGNGGLQYLNVWTEWPNSFSFWPRPNSEFYPFFTSAVSQLKTSHPTKKVGGPGMLSSYMCKGLPVVANEPYQLVNYMYQNNVKPDFFTFHVFSSNPMNYYNASKQYSDMLLGVGSFNGVPWAGTGFFDTTELIIDAWGNTNNPTNEFGASTGTYNPTDMDKYLAKKEGSTAFLAAWAVLQRANVERGYYYRSGDMGPTTSAALANGASLGLFYGDGSYKRVAYAFKMCANLYSNYNKILNTSLINVTNQNDSIFCLSGMSINGTKALLIANTTMKNIDVNLTVNGSSIVSANYSSIEYYLIDNTSDGTNPQVWNPSITNTIASQTGVLVVLTPINVVSVAENRTSSDITVYPNPTNGDVNIILQNQNLVSTKIYNLIGELIQEVYTSEFSISNLPNGIYFLQIQTNNSTYTSKIIKNNP